MTTIKQKRTTGPAFVINGVTVYGWREVKKYRAMQDRIAARNERYRQQIGR